MVPRDWISGAVFPVVCGDRIHPARDEKAEEEQRNATSGTRCEELRRLLHGPAELRDTAPAFGRGASVPCQATQPQVAREERLRRRRDRANVTRRRCCSGRLAGTLPLTALRQARGKGRAAPRRGRLSAPAGPPGARAGSAPSAARPPYCRATQTCYTRAPTPPPPPVAPPAAAALPPPERGGGGCAGPAPAAGKAPRGAGTVRRERRSPPQVGAPGGAGCAPARGGGDGGGGRAEEQEAAARERSAVGQRLSVPAALSPTEVGVGLRDSAWGRAVPPHLRNAVGPAA